MITADSHAAVSSHRRTTTQRAAAFVAVAAVCAIATSCSSGTAADDSPSGARSNGASSSGPAVTTVPAGSYQDEPNVFRWRQQGTPPRDCMLYAGAPAVQCSMTFPPNTPPVVLGPSRTHAPNTIILGINGIEHAYLEHTPTPRRILQPNHQITAGITTCTALANTGIDCTQTTGYSFRYANGTLTTNKTAPTTSSITAPAPQQTLCPGATPTNRDTLVTVLTGTLPCDTATAVMNHYRTLPPTANNATNPQQFNGWNCTTPSPKDARTLRYSRACRRGNITLTNPAE